jgi:AcrR family transcriptional regulator
MTSVTEARLSIRDVVERTGVPVTTIHHYVRTGVMPPPHRECANRFTYDESHVLALQLIRVLRQRQIPLSVIGQVLPELMAADEQLRAEIWARILAAPSKTTSPAADAVMQRVLEAATREFSRHGYADANVASISEAAGLAKGSLYRLFPSKESLFLATAEAVVARATAAFAAAASQAGGRIPEDQATTTLHRRRARRHPLRVASRRTPAPRMGPASFLAPPGPPGAMRPPGPAALVCPAGPAPPPPGSLGSASSVGLARTAWARGPGRPSS